MTFLSHGPEKPPLLDDHLIYVGKRAQKLASDSCFTSKDIAYYAGLFHDLGKLNPYYQKLFCGENIDALLKIYHPFHAPYSCWFTKYLLKQTTLNIEDRQRVMMIIDGHHSKMKNTPGNYFGDEKRKPQTVQETLTNWIVFKNSCKNKIKELDFDIMPSCDKMKYDKLLKLKSDEDTVDAFLECGYFFSCVLQADRGSFSDFKVKKLDDSFVINTEKLVDPAKTLSDFRNSFQSEVQKNIDTTNPINVINAPTGTGKTKAFLDLIKKYNPDRVFYFSPLLALTDDIGKKLSDVCGDSSTEILVYHHIFTGSLKQKTTSESNTVDEDTKNEPYKWNFDYEAFNEKLVITTTQRLLMTLYSDGVRDKLKLASFRNSLLIIDEVQTLPKFLLKNIIKILQSMSKNLNTKTLLVSATIPYELSELPKITMTPDVLQRYQKEKNRTITKSDILDVNKIKLAKTLIMCNTRKEARKRYDELEIKNKHYISSGLTKKHRNKILSSLSENSILVSTQVVEAGVDISFDQIWRQMAPIDNIIQVMGRLDRESKNKSSALHIFDVNTEKYTPYSSLEFKESQKIIKNISDSVQLYEKLGEYYDTVSTKNKTQSDLETDLESHMSRLDFKEVWKMVQKYIGENFYDSVYVPSLDDWSEIKSDLLSKSKYRIKKHAELSALLPAKAFTMQEFFDEELYENNILYPKKDMIEKLYDDEIGLDKWIK